MIGWKVGYCVALVFISVEIRKVYQYLIFLVNILVQLVFVDMLCVEFEYYFALLDFYCQKCDILVNVLNESWLEILLCEGIYFLLVDYSVVFILDDVEFCQWLMQEYGVVVILLLVFCVDFFLYKLIRFCFVKKELMLLVVVECLCQFQLFNCLGVGILMVGK